MARVWEVHLRLDQHALGRERSGAVAVGIDWSLVRHWKGAERGQNRGAERGVTGGVSYRRILEPQKGGSARAYRRIHSGALGAFIHHSPR